MATATLRMTQVPITSRYGPRTLNGRPNTHKGTDHAFGNAMGVSTYGDGVVTHAGRRGGADAERGIFVEVAHANGIGTSYHSLSRVTVKAGQSVRMGDIVGYGGKTATGATGHHCHVGLWLRGNHVDETRFLKPGVKVTINENGSVSVAGGNATPINNTPSTPANAGLTSKDEKLRLSWDTGGTGYLVSEKGWLGLPSMQIYNLFNRLIYRATPDTFLKAEVDLMAHHQRLLDLQHETKVEIDPTKLASAVADELRKKGITVDLKDLDWSAETGELIAKQVATAYETAIPRITKAILKSSGDALTAAGK